MNHPVRWTVEWRSKYDHHIMWDRCFPLLFKTRKEARAWIEDHYSHNRTRVDLRSAPHHWRMPRAVAVEVRLVPVKKARRKK